ncbi:DNA/RNA polymerase, partial [Ascodesmis nigricans]
MHIDFDCFFAAVSIRDQPQHADKPVAVSHGSSDASEIASCNYIARGFGVKNGMWMSTARKLCPGIIVLPYEFAKYEAASREFYDVVLGLNALKVQAVSIDEVLVDVTNLINDSTHPDIDGEETRALDMATRIRDRCRERTNCEVSVGIGPNILLAKLALRAAKPAGQYILRTSTTASFLATKNVRDLPGIGPKTSELILRSFGTDTIADIRDIKASRLAAVLGPKTGQRVYELCRGIDPTPVGAANEVERKSYSINVNWGVRFISADQPERFVKGLCEELAKRMKEDAVVGGSLVVTIAARHPQAERRTEKWLGCGKTESMARSVRLVEPTAEAEVMGRVAARVMR